jgi:hypothetical protein
MKKIIGKVIAVISGVVAGILAFIYVIGAFVMNIFLLLLPFFIGWFILQSLYRCTVGG